MRHFYIRKAVILAVRTASLGMLVPALLLALGGIAESLGPWWLYALVCLGFVCASVLLIGWAKRWTESWPPTSRIGSGYRSARSTVPGGTAHESTLQGSARPYWPPCCWR